MVGREGFPSSGTNDFSFVVADFMLERGEVSPILEAMAVISVVLVASVASS